MSQGGLRTPELSPGSSSKWRSEPQRAAAVVAREAESEARNLGEERGYRLCFSRGGGQRGRRRRSRANSEFRRRARDAGEELLGFPRSLHRTSQHPSEVALRLRTDDANGSASACCDPSCFTSSPASSVSPTRACFGTEGVDLLVVRDGFVEHLEERRVDAPPFEVRRSIAGAAFADAGGAAGDVEAPTCEIRHDVVGIDGQHVPRVEVIDPPPLVAVLERVLLSAAAAHDRDEAVGRDRGARDDVDLVAV